MLGGDTICFVLKLLNFLPWLLPILTEDESRSLIMPLKNNASAMQHGAVFIPRILSVVKAL